LDTLDKNQLCLQQPVSDDVFCAIVALLSATDVSDLVSYVPHRTVEQNIRYGKPDATRAEIEEAAKRANAFDFIMSFNDGFETQVGDKGSQLSGGQKQRIGELTMHLL
jgi:ABC-type multidrug transport system fused ATPase/permease subunit